jgi:hypothetical protein
VRNYQGFHSALRALGNRWLEVLWHCLTRGIRCDENIRMRNRHTQPAA